MVKGKESSSKPSVDDNDDDDDGDADDPASPRGLNQSREEPP